MKTYVGDLIRLFGENDWHEVIGALGEEYDIDYYELSDGRIVSDMGIEAVLQDETSIGPLDDTY